MLAAACHKLKGTFLMDKLLHFKSWFFHVGIHGVCNWLIITNRCIFKWSSAIFATSILYRHTADSGVAGGNGLIRSVVAADSGSRILSSVIANELSRAA
jgi:hypothetical protein